MSPQRAILRKKKKESDALTTRPLTSPFCAALALCTHLYWDLGVLRYAHLRLLQCVRGTLELGRSPQPCCSALFSPRSSDPLKRSLFPIILVPTAITTSMWSLLLWLRMKRPTGMALPGIKWRSPLKVRVLPFITFNALFHHYAFAFGALISYFHIMMLRSRLHSSLGAAKRWHPLAAFASAICRSIRAGFAFHFSWYALFPLWSDS